MDEMTAETSTIQETTETTSQDVADVQSTDVDTSTSQETETNDTASEETQETDVNDAENKTTQNVDYEKSYKELQAEYTRSQQRLRDLEARMPQKPQIVDDNGRVNPQFEMNFNYKVEAFEYNSYRNLATQLDSDVMPEVMDKLNRADNCYKMGDIHSYKTLMNEIKEYFNPTYIEQITEQKAMLKAQKGDYINQAIAEQRAFNGAKLEYDLRQSPEVWELVNPESEFYSAETFGIVKQMFDTYGTVDIELTTNAIKAIENNAIRKYKASLEAQKTADINKQKASITSGDGQVTSNSVEFGSPEYWENFYSKK